MFGSRLGAARGALERAVEVQDFAAARAFEEWDDHARCHANIAATLRDADFQSAGRGSRGS